MLIQWFPGHMAKAMRKTEEDLKLCDGVIYVLDARAPYACFNKKLTALFKNKPVVYCVNKCDTVSTASLGIISEELKKAGLNYCLTDGLSKKDVAKLKSACESVMRERIERDKAKGIKRALRFMVAGIPNTGKSTIINTISGGKRAETGDKAGVTRANKWIRLGDFELLDTPGTMPPSFENQTYARHLAYIGSLNDDILDTEGLALELIGELKIIAPDKLMEKYSLTSLDKEPLALYDDICKRRGFLLRGGESDYTRCARAVIDDFRKQRIGKICLEERWK
ncbi:MAG: ribosome biogenesis GTPase YlqF [Candidatus Borkfalkiaceae bacterium]|nr:ribosome biogenesis GTPase YlqF [Christensenellaceae bacterium]